MSAFAKYDLFTGGRPWTEFYLTLCYALRFVLLLLLLLLILTLTLTTYNYIICYYLNV